MVFQVIMTRLMKTFCPMYKTLPPTFSTILPSTSMHSIVIVRDEKIVRIPIVMGKSVNQLSND